VRKFVATAKKHRLSLDRPRIICPCNSCKNKLAQKDNVVQSHLVRYGFAKDYTVWKFHGEADSSAGASWWKLVDIEGNGKCRTTTLISSNSNSSRKHKVGDRKKRSTIRASLEQ